MRKSSLFLLVAGFAVLLQLGCKKDGLIEEPLSIDPPTADTADTTDTSMVPLPEPEYECRRRTKVIDIDSIVSLPNPTTVIIIDACECDTLTIEGRVQSFPFFGFQWINQETELIIFGNELEGITSQWVGELWMDDGGGLPVITLPLVIDFDKCEPGD